MATPEGGEQSSGTNSFRNVAKPYRQGLTAAASGDPLHPMSADA